ncbi:MAG: hypothetical protein IPH95_10125 [Candidatus Promineofilum sp.]|nr:hypothetical protein [Promineifilum sp.]
MQRAWMGDDAFITLRTVDNFVAGRGLVYNVGERVQSSPPGALAPLVLPTSR